MDTHVIAMVMVSTLLVVALGYWLSDRKPGDMFVAAVWSFTAVWYAVSNGLPIWRDYPAGDAFDIGSLVFLVVCYCRSDHATSTLRIINKTEGPPRAVTKMDRVTAVAWLVAGLAMVGYLGYRGWDTYKQRQDSYAFMHRIEARDVANQRGFHAEMVRLHRLNDQIEFGK